MFFGSVRVMRSIYHVQTSQIRDEVIADIEQGLPVDLARHILQSRFFAQVRGDGFVFRNPPIETETILSYFIGTAPGPDKGAFMIRLEHRNGVVINIDAEPLRFK